MVGSTVPVFLFLYLLVSYFESGQTSQFKLVFLIICYILSLVRNLTTSSRRINDIGMLFWSSYFFANWFVLGFSKSKDSGPDKLDTALKESNDIRNQTRF